MSAPCASAMPVVKSADMPMAIAKKCLHNFSPIKTLKPYCPQACNHTLLACPDTFNFLFDHACQTPGMGTGHAKQWYLDACWTSVCCCTLRAPQVASERSCLCGRDSCIRRRSQPDRQRSGCHAIMGIAMLSVFQSPKAIFEEYGGSQGEILVLSYQIYSF